MEHPDENASDNCERNGDFSKTEENRKAGFKSRRAYVVFYAAVIAAVFLFCFLGYGLAYARAYGWHRGEIEEAARIAHKYDSIAVYFWDDDIKAKGEAGLSGISAEDESRLKQIYRSLRWDYVSSMWFGGSGSTKFIIELSGAYIRSYLVRYKDNVEISQVKRDYPKKTVTRLDGHWWYVR